MESALQTLMQERALETIKSASGKNSVGNDDDAAEGKGGRNSYARLHELFAEYFVREFEDLLTEQDEYTADDKNSASEETRREHQQEKQLNEMTSSSATLEKRGGEEDRNFEKKDDSKWMIVKFLRSIIQSSISMFSSSKMDTPVSDRPSCNDGRPCEHQINYNISTDISLPRSKQSKKDQKRDVYTILNDIFQEYIENHMTVPTYENVVDEFVNSNALVQENLATEEISAFTQKLIEIVTNFGCIKKNFAKETGGYDATGLMVPQGLDIEAFGNNRTEFSPFA